MAGPLTGRLGLSQGGQASHRDAGPLSAGGRASHREAGPLKRRPDVSKGVQASHREARPLTGILSLSQSASKLAQ